jgi:hypothetical protein
MYGWDVQYMETNMSVTRYYIPVSFNKLAAAFWITAGTAVYMEVFLTTCNKSLF